MLRGEHDDEGLRGVGRVVREESSRELQVSGPAQANIGPKLHGWTDYIVMITLNISDIVSYITQEYK